MPDENMKRRCVKKDLAVKKTNRATTPIYIRTTETVTIKPAETNMDNSTSNLDGDNNQKGHILFLIFLAIGMILQLTGNNYCVLTGTVVCVSACGFICSWVFFSAVLVYNDSKSLSAT